jgi:hypothetical protein
MELRGNKGSNGSLAKVADHTRAADFLPECDGMVCAVYIKMALYLKRLFVGICMEDWAAGRI